MCSRCQEITNTVQGPGCRDRKHLSRRQVWADPLAASEAPAASSAPQGDTWRSLTRTAWDLDPCLALELKSRYAQHHAPPASEQGARMPVDMHRTVLILRTAPTVERTIGGSAGLHSRATRCCPPSHIVCLFGIDG